MTTQQATEAGAKSVFDRPRTYLRHDAHIDVRAEIVRALLGDVRGSILDIGCGDGRISLQFNHATRVELVDLSPNMLALARDRVPAELRDRVRTVEASLGTYDAGAGFDVVLCIGVLAHVPDVAAAMQTLAKAVVPGGKLVVQLTDHGQPLARAFMALSRAKHLLRNPIGYSVNRTDQASIVGFARAAGLELAAERPHWTMPPFAGFVPVSVSRTLLRYAANTPPLAHVGSEKILLFTKP
ncbi:MAG: class I SAM-dependent methyltransferase [Polyangiaceae bacterium]